MKNAEVFSASTCIFAFLHTEVFVYMRQDVIAIIWHL